MIWSILISGIPERYHLAQPLLYSLLETQGVARMPDVELLYLLDNKRRSVGAKRNALMDAAVGEYISYVDDDDEVSADYVSKIRRSIEQTRKSETPADVICFNQRAVLQPHGIIHECSYSLEHAKREPKRQLAPITGSDGKPRPDALAWTGPPAHTMVWRRALVSGLRFPDEQFGEDVAWVDQACALAKHEAQVAGAEPLYIYKFDAERSATRG